MLNFTKITFLVYNAMDDYVSICIENVTIHVKLHQHGSVEKNTTGPASFMWYILLSDVKYSVHDKKLKLHPFPVFTIPTLQHVETLSCEWKHCDWLPPVKIIEIRRHMDVRQINISSL